MSDGERVLQGAYVVCEESLRGGSDADRDIWLAALFAPFQTRRHIHALYAFSREIARIPEIVSQPTLGEIRIQWWIEALEGARAGEAASHPVGAALFDTISRLQLPRAPLVALAEARRFDLYADPMPSLNDLEGYCGETISALIRLASIIAAGGKDPGGAEAAGHAGVALGIARIIADLPMHAARGTCYLPADVLARHGALPEAAAAGLSSPAMIAAVDELRQLARDHAARAWSAARAMAPEGRVALLPLALVDPLVTRGAGEDPFRPRSPFPQWRRQWRLWRASRRL
jgi:phytoene synthase